MKNTIFLFGDGTGMLGQKMCLVDEAHRHYEKKEADARNTRIFDGTKRHEYRGLEETEKAHTYFMRSILIDFNWLLVRICAM